MDLIYNPPVSQLLKNAAAAGCTTMDGEHMLLHQGASSFELWTGKPAPIAAMQAELDRAREHGPRQLDIDMGRIDGLPPVDGSTGARPSTMRRRRQSASRRPLAWAASAS